MIAGSHSIATSDTALLTARNEHRRKAGEYDIKQELIKTKQIGSWQRTSITPIFGIAGLKYPVVFHRILGFVWYFNFLIFPRFVAEPQMGIVGLRQHKHRDYFMTLYSLFIK